MNAVMKVLEKMERNVVPNSRVQSPVLATAREGSSCEKAVGMGVHGSLSQLSSCHVVEAAGRR